MQGYIVYYLAEPISSGRLQHHAGPSIFFFLLLLLFSFVKHVAMCVHKRVLLSEGLGFRINNQAPLQPLALAAIGEETALTSAVLVPRGSPASCTYPCCIIDGW